MLRCQGMAEGNRLPALENAPHLKTDGEFFFESLRLPLAKGSSTFLTKPLFPQGREDVTALWCSKPLRYKVGGPSKVFAIVLQDGTALLQLAITLL